LEDVIMPRTDKYPFRPELRGRLVEVASRGETTGYLALGLGRAMIGRFLARIASEEGVAKRPPLTSVVVHEKGGLPGPGFLEAMRDAGFIKGFPDPDADPAGYRRALRETHARALEETHDYWRPKLDDYRKPRKP
jgi:hypothetical protein